MAKQGGYKAGGNTATRRQHGNPAAVGVGARLHLGLRVQSADNRVEARPKLEIVERLVLFPDCILCIYLGALQVACGQRAGAAMSVAGV